MASLQNANVGDEVPGAFAEGFGGLFDGGEDLHFGGCCMFGGCWLCCVMFVHNMLEDGLARFIVTRMCNVGLEHTGVESVNDDF
jgi:hypothetical protein